MLIQTLQHKHSSCDTAAVTRSSGSCTVNGTGARRVGITRVYACIDACISSTESRLGQTAVELKMEGRSNKSALDNRRQQLTWFKPVLMCGSAEHLRLAATYSGEKLGVYWSLWNNCCVLDLAARFSTFANLKCPH